MWQRPLKQVSIRVGCNCIQSMKKATTVCFFWNATLHDGITHKVIEIIKFWKKFLKDSVNALDAGNHLITKILLELKSFPLNHDVVLQWNKEWLVLFTIRASVELEITDFAIIVKIIKVIFIYWRNHLFSFLPPTFYLLLTRLAEWRECCVKKKKKLVATP